MEVFLIKALQLMLSRSISFSTLGSISLSSSQSILIRLMVSDGCHWVDIAKSLV